MAPDPRIDALPASNDTGEGQEGVHAAPGTARMLADVVLGGVAAVFSFDSSRAFQVVNDNRRRAQAAAARVVPEIRPATAEAPKDFVAAPVADVPPPVPQSGLTRFGDRAMPEFDLRPATVDPLDADPFGLEGPASGNVPPAANDGDPVITRIRA